MLFKTKIPPQAVVIFFFQKLLLSFFMKEWFTILHMNLRFMKAVALLKKMKLMLLVPSIYLLIWTDYIVGFIYYFVILFMSTFGLDLNYQWK